MNLWAMRKRSGQVLHVTFGAQQAGGGSKGSSRPVRMSPNDREQARQCFCIAAGRRGDREHGQREDPENLFARSFTSFLQ